MKINGCIQQTKQFSERSMIIYYDWFLHLSSEDLKARIVSIVLKTY